MDYNKLSPEIFSAERDNLAKLAALFPATVKDGEVDFDALREELGQFEEVGAEKYELTWAGKQNAKKAAQTDIAGRTLKYVPEDSKDADTTQNLYIEGDNLEVLKLLRQNYYGAVKMIYIDPPYNTGNDFVYRDDFAVSKAESDEAEGETVDGKRMVVNQKSSNRYHANWLNMMYPRLKVAKDLLRDDGVIFISIDDNEVAQLRKICDEVFGAGNFRNQIVVRRGAKSVQAQFETWDKLGQDIEHILFYTKDENYRFPQQRKKLDEKKQGAWNNHWRGTDRPTMRYEIFGATPESGQWRWSRERSLKAIENYEKMLSVLGATADSITQEQIDDYYATFSDEIDFLRLSKNGKPEHYVAPTDSTLLNTSWYDLLVGSSSEITDLFDTKVFDTAKLTAVIERMLRFCDKNAIILDFFSGSATTAHAVMQLNAEDGGNRQHIMVQFPEICDEKSEAAKAGYANICEIGKERIRRAGEKIKAEIEAENAQLKLGEEQKKVPDIGFRVFRTADTNIRWTHMALEGEMTPLEVEEMLRDKDKLDFMPGYTDIDVVYEVLLRQRDIPLSSKVEKLNIGNRTYLFADAYIVCLDDNVTREMVEELAAVEPTPIKYVFRDSAFNDDISLKDETVRRLQAYIARNNGEQKKTYTVEFI